MSTSAQSPVVVVASFRPRPEAHDLVRSALRTAAERVHEEPGCELYALHETDGRLVLVEKWSTEGHLDQHGGGDALKELHAAVDSRLLAPAEVLRLSPLPAGRPEAGQL
ncbi:antibiotic biosynthesis monooxygenase [Streptomyces sp. NBC_01795]|uniref:putative quinol monooxygenase n=1 Tax=unclassified Streptomyces TaxID=2593676 RepID=UPI002DD7F643|nr:MULTISPECIES: putative quinol monooxygenase [unclassified Streptomyces]WSA94914.1 antibiotic biosynthesis monooxygenase [Streptomyces sp. NBC_01795]WSS12460.1 antibiotic biosynthesis monooxygenase [Streptomyces sp. NBC_01186]